MWLHQWNKKAVVQLGNAPVPHQDPLSRSRKLGKLYTDVITQFPSFVANKSNTALQQDV